MNIDILNKQKMDNALKAKSILESEDGSVEEATKLLSANDELDVKIEALKKVNDLVIPVVEPVKEVKSMEFSRIVPVTSIKNLPFEGTNDEKLKTAYAFGMIAKSLTGDKKAAKWLSENYEYKAQNETTNTAGGYLVPDELQNSLVFLREAYGVARRECNVVPMMSDTYWQPINSASTTGYWVGESTAITQSQVTLDRAEILAKKLAILTYVSSELVEDAIVDAGAMLAQDMAWRLSFIEDQAVFLGDGTPTYGSITGIGSAVNGVASNAGSVSAASGSAANWTAVTLANLRTVISKLPTYADDANAKWYMHKQFYHQVVCNRLDALSGNAILDISNANSGNPTLFGYPIVFVQHLPSTAAGTTGTPLCYFGNLKKGTLFGDRREVKIAVSSDYAFNTDELVYKAVERFGFTAFDKGTSSIAGSMVVLNRLT